MALANRMTFDAAGSDRADKLTAEETSHVLIEGFRCWMTGFENGSVTPWERGWNFYAKTFERAEARQLTSALVCVVRCYRAGGASWCQCLPFECRTLCCSERLLLGMMSALHHGNEVMFNHAVDVWSGARVNASEKTALIEALTSLSHAFKEANCCFAEGAIQQILALDGHHIDRTRH